MCVCMRTCVYMYVSVFDKLVVVVVVVVAIVTVALGDQQAEHKAEM